jgi:hypothetical protein
MTEHCWDTEPTESVTYTPPPDYGSPWVIRQCCDCAVRGCKALLIQMGDAAPIVYEPAMETMTDPRGLGGEIAGPGGPFDGGNVVIDASNAIIVDYQEICKIDPNQGARGQLAFALVVGGRINQTQDRAKVMCIEGLDGLAALVTEIHGVAERAGVTKEFMEACEKRWKVMPHGG